METIYLTDNGLQLKKQSERIVVKKEGRVQREIRIRDLKRILVFGNNQLSTQLLHALAKQGIEVGFISRQSRFKFRLVPETSKNIYLRQAQHDAYRDTHRRVELSRGMVSAKIHNQRSLLVRYRPDVDLSPTLVELKRSIQRAAEQSSVAEIMGVEGFASKCYFKAYDRLVGGDFEFSGRKYYPPPDPVNALLSFGYMLIFYELSGLLKAHGFDAYLGFLHSIRYGRASLATDLMEDLRPAVFDRLVLVSFRQACAPRFFFCR